MVSLDAWRWIALVLLMAGFLLVHASLVIRTARMPGLTPAQRLLTIGVPPLTALFAFRLGAKRRAVLWWVLGVFYWVVRSTA